MSFDLQVNNGDLVVSNTGDLAAVQGIDKLKQDVLKIALTPVGGNLINPWYGSLVNRTLVGSYLSSDIILDVAKTQLQTALETLKSLQNVQVSSGQNVSPDEQLSFIKSINVVRSNIDPRNIQVNIQVYSRAFGQASVAFSLSNQ